MPVPPPDLIIVAASLGLSMSRYESVLDNKQAASGPCFFAGINQTWLLGTNSRSTSPAHGAKILLFLRVFLGSRNRPTTGERYPAILGAGLASLASNACDTPVWRSGPWLVSARAVAPWSSQSAVPEAEDASAAGSFCQCCAHLSAFPCTGIARANVGV